MRTLIPALVVLLFSAPAIAIDGLAPAGPCASAEGPVTSPVALLFSPVDVASANAPASTGVNPPEPNGFAGRGACDTIGGCGGLNDVPNIRVAPPVNPPTTGSGPGTGAQ